MAAYTPADLAVHLQTDVDTASAVLALKVATDVVRTYTRGAGFDPLTGQPSDDLGFVVLKLAGREYRNPTSFLAETAGARSVRHGEGWTLPELAVLNTYRRRAA